MNKVNHSSRRTAQLEQKLDSIVTLLTKRQQNFSIPSASDLPVESPPNVRLSSQFPPPKQNVLQSSPAGTAQTSAIYQAPEHHSPSDSTRYFADPDDLFRNLSDWRDSPLSLRCHPPGTTAGQLHQQNSFLYSAIMMSVAFRDVSKQIAMAKDITTDLSVRLLQKGEKSMDLLQGLLAYSAWFVFYLFPRATMSTLYR